MSPTKAKEFAKAIGALTARARLMPRTEEVYVNWTDKISAWEVGEHFESIGYKYRVSIFECTKRKKIWISKAIK